MEGVDEGGARKMMAQPRRSAAAVGLAPEAPRDPAFVKEHERLTPAGLAPSP